MLTVPLRYRTVNNERVLLSETMVFKTRTPCLLTSLYKVFGYTRDFWHNTTKRNHLIDILRSSKSYVSAPRPWADHGDSSRAATHNDTENDTHMGVGKYFRDCTWQSCAVVRFSLLHILHAILPQCSTSWNPPKGVVAIRKYVIPAQGFARCHDEIHIVVEV